MTAAGGARPPNSPTPLVRNVDVDPDAAVRDWPFEAIHAAIDRGSLADWRRLAAEIRIAPWGQVARAVEDITAWAEHPGVDQALRAVVERARADVVTDGRARWAAWVRSLRHRTGLPMRAFARLAGTSGSRLSDYENGRVAPTTDTLARLEHAARVARCPAPPSPARNPT